MEQREILFQIWDKEKKRMSKPLPVFHSFIQWSDGDIDMPTDFAISRNERFVFRQYTGLEDKNQAKVYEGDIVKEWIKRYDLEKPEGEDTYYEFRTSQIVYSGHGFWVKDESFGWEGEDLWDWDNLEVMGNIYQTPELLNHK